MEEGKCMHTNLYKAARHPGTNIPYEVNNPQFMYRTVGDNNNALHIAAQYGNNRFITRVCNQDAGLQLLCQENCRGETPLHLAAHFGNMETVYALLQAHNEPLPSGLNVRKDCWSEKDHKGDTPLHKALRNRHEDIALLLLERNIQLASVDNIAGESPVYLAAENSCNKVLQRLIEGSRDNRYAISFSGLFGKTVYHSARRLSEDVMNSLIEIRRGDILKVRDHKGKTTLHYAVEENRLPMVKILLAADSSLAYLTDNDFLTPLHMASNNGLFPMVSAILESSPQALEIYDSKGKTALHLAKMDASFVQQCIEKTSMVKLINHRDSDGNTPLHIAVTQGEHFSAYKLIMHEECNWRLRNNEGYSPLDLCELSGIPYMSQCYYALRCLNDGHHKKATENKLNRSWFFRKVRYMFFLQLEGMEEELLKPLLDKMGLLAVLLLSLSWVSSSTIPGGYSGKDRRPLLIENVAYNICILLQLLAFFSAALVLMAYTLGVTRKKNKRNIVRLSILGIQLSIVCLIMPYVIGWSADYF